MPDHNGIPDNEDPITNASTWIIPFTMLKPQLVGQSLMLCPIEGSAIAGTLNGGTGMVVTEVDPVDPTILLMKQQSGETNTWSYDEEKAAMSMALEWLLLLHKAAAMCTDIKSILKAI